MKNLKSEEEKMIKDIINLFRLKKMLTELKTYLDKIRPYLRDMISSNLTHGRFNQQ